MRNTSSGRPDREEFLVETYNDQNERINDFKIIFMKPLPNMYLPKAYIGITPQEINCLLAVRAAKIRRDEKNRARASF